MFTCNVVKLFRKTFGPWVTPAPANRKPRRALLRLEALEERWCPATVNMYWDPTSLSNASTAANWDQGSLGSGVHPAAAPGNTANETDNIYFDGTATQGGNKSCTWDYTPTNKLGLVYFQNGWNQTVSFSDKQGFTVSSASATLDTSMPTLTPNGASGTNAVAAITLTNGALFNVSGGSKLLLTGYSGPPRTPGGNAIYFAGDGTAGEYLANGGTVTYTGSGNQDNVDYMKIPVLNSWSGVFQVNGKGSTGTGSQLQVSGADSTNTKGVSFYQNSGGETDIYGGGILWCYNDFRMDDGKLQTTDSNADGLKVGTSSVDGTAYLLGGTVNINPGTNVYGILQILGTTQTNNPILDVGSATLNFKVNMTQGTNQCDQLIVGGTIGTGPGTGKVNFGYNGGTTTVAIQSQGTTRTGHAWQVILFGTENGDVTLNPATGYTKNWQMNYLEIDN